MFDGRPCLKLESRQIGTQTDMGDHITLATKNGFRHLLEITRVIDL